MIVIPAIDLRGGACVRLTQGDPERETVYNRDPALMARRFAAAGATRLHVVDLDGAFEGHPVNLEAIAAIAGAVDVPLEVGGGIRNRDHLVQVFRQGAHWAILGTAVLDDLEFVREAVTEFPGRIVVGLDARDGFLATRGWLATSRLSAVDAGLMVGEIGVKQVIYTDIGRDGMLAGPNVSATRELARRTGLSVIASGGVRDLEDIRALGEGRDAGGGLVDGVIVGKALYTGALDLAAAVALCLDGQERRATD